jgi:hypothetical protein
LRKFQVIVNVMKEEFAISKVKQRLELIQGEITQAKARLSRLEVEAKKLMTTIEVLENLGEDTIAFDSAPTIVTSQWVTLSDLMNVGGVLKPTTRQLIVAQFMKGEHLTKNEVVARIKAADPEVNEGTVATTLSKLTADGILEKAEGNAYRLKVAPGAENTGDTNDLLKY